MQMTIFNLINDEEFLEIAGFDNTTMPIQNRLSTQTQSCIRTDQENIVPSEYVTFPTVEEYDEQVSEDDESCDLSADSFESDGGLFREELNYDVEEMYEWRATNRSLRQNRLNGTLPQEVGITSQQCELDKDVGDGTSYKGSRFWTTYEGGYVSDQISSEDESRKLSDDESDVDLPVHKRMKGATYKLFHDKTDTRNVELSVGLRFASRKIFKEAILAYSIQQHKDLIYMKNDKKHIHVGCSLCKWELTAGPDLSDASGWQIKSMQPVHNCVRTMNNRLITESWLTNEYLDKILKDPLMTPTQIKEDMKVRYGITMGSKKCQRAKEKALNAVTTLMRNQYGVLKSYLLELVKSNPGTTCVLKTLEGEPGQPKTFQRFNVCFDALRKSFIETCRPIFGLDGCFLKHACGGQLLAAVGRDGNNHMFPIAWAVVERENQSSWEWFCKLLSEDLKMEQGAGWTVISDQQKGLIGAIESLWPEAEHRNCARHIYSNWSKNHKGRVLEKQFWKCVKATSKGDYEFELAQLKEISEQAYDDFIRRSPEHFCKSFFKTDSCCDVVDNNMAETFNSFILLSRYKPIVSMFEDIRMALMERNRQNLGLVNRFVAGVAPRVSLKLLESYEQQQKCECKWNGEDSQSGFEVIHNGVSHAVNIDHKTCSCRSWDLTGIPCCHAMSALLCMRIQPESTLPKWYTLETYKQTYSNFLKPVPGNTFWDREGEGMVLPPDIIKSKTGGRRKKARRRDRDEVPKNRSKYCRKGLPTKCGKCGEQGHDKRKCPLPNDSSPVQNVESSRYNENNLGRDNVGTQVWNRGRKKGGRNRLGRTLDDVSPPSEYVKKIRGQKDMASIRTQGEGTSSSWLEAVAARRGRARARGSGGMSRGRYFTPHGIGVYFGNEGEVIYKGSTTTPGIIINEPTVSTEATFPNQPAPRR